MKRKRLLHQAHNILILSLLATLFSLGACSREELSVEDSQPRAKVFLSIGEGSGDDFRTIASDGATPHPVCWSIFSQNQSPRIKLSNTGILTQLNMLCVLRNEEQNKTYYLKLPFKQRSDMGLEYVLSATPLDKDLMGQRIEIAPTALSGNVSGNYLQSQKSGTWYLMGLSISRAGFDEVNKQMPFNPNRTGAYWSSVQEMSAVSLKIQEVKWIRGQDQPLAFGWRKLKMEQNRDGSVSLVLADTNSSNGLKIQPQGVLFAFVGKSNVSGYGDIKLKALKVYSNVLSTASGYYDLANLPNVPAGAGDNGALPTWVSSDSRTTDNFYNGAYAKLNRPQNPDLETSQSLGHTPTLQSQYAWWDYIPMFWAMPMANVSGQDARTEIKGYLYRQNREAEYTNDYTLCTSSQVPQNGSSIVLKGQVKQGFSYQKNGSQI